MITSRTAAHADALAAQVSGRTVPWAQMRRAIATADIVVTATGSQRPIITREDVQAVTGRRRTEPLFFIDVAVPRDVDPAVSEFEQGSSKRRDLRGSCRRTWSGASPRWHAEAIVAESARFTVWQRSRRRFPPRRPSPAFDDIRRAELHRLEPRFSVCPGARRLGKVTRLIVEKLRSSPPTLKALRRGNPGAYTSLEPPSCSEMTRRGFGAPAFARGFVAAGRPQSPPREQDPMASLSWHARRPRAVPRTRGALLHHRRLACDVVVIKTPATAGRRTAVVVGAASFRQETRTPARRPDRSAVLAQQHRHAVPPAEGLAPSASSR